jgi:hypothetical protein
VPPDRSEKPEPDLPFLLIARMIMFVSDLAPPLRGIHRIINIAYS